MLVWMKAVSSGVATSRRNVASCPGSHAQGNVAHPLDEPIHRVRVDGVIGRAELGVAGRQKDVELVERVHDVDGREVPRLQLLAVEIGQHGPDLSAVDDRRIGAGRRP